MMDTTFKKRPPQNRRKKRTPLIIGLIIVLILIGLQYSTSVFSPDVKKDAWGKIILPAAGAKQGQTVKVVGETQEIASGYYIWLALDCPDTGLCQPQKRVLRNTRFNTTLVLAKKPGNSCNLSLYVLDETHHHQWSDWQDQKTVKNLPSPPKTSRLDRVLLISDP